MCINRQQQDSEAALDRGHLGRQQGRSQSCIVWFVCVPISATGTVANKLCTSQHHHTVQCSVLCKLRSRSSCRAADNISGLVALLLMLAWRRQGTCSLPTNVQSKFWDHTNSLKTPQSAVLAASAAAQVVTLLLHAAGVPVDIERSDCKARRNVIQAQSPPSKLLVEASPALRSAACQDADPAAG